MLRSILAALCLALLAAPPAHAALELPTFGHGKDEKPRIEVEFEGVEGPLLENVRAMSSLHRLAAYPMASTSLSQLKHSVTVFARGDK